MKKIILSVLLLVGLLCSCASPNSGNENNTEGKYDFGKADTDSQTEQDSDDKNIYGTVRLLNSDQIPLKFDKTVTYSSKQDEYYMSIVNKNSEPVDCTVFVYFKKRLVPISVDGAGERDYYCISVKENESMILPVNINLDGIACKNDQTAYVCAVFTAKKDLEKLKAKDIVFGYGSMSMDMLNFKSKSEGKQPAESNQFTHNGIEADCINGGRESRNGKYYGLSFGDKISADERFECTSHLKQSRNDALYLRCQAKLGIGDTCALILIDGKPVKAFDGKYFAAFNQGGQNAFSFLIDKGVISPGEHLASAVEFHDDESKYEDSAWKDCRTMEDTGLTLIDVD